MTRANAILTTTISRNRQRRVSANISRAYVVEYANSTDLYKTTKGFTLIRIEPIYYCKCRNNNVHGNIW